MFAVLIREPCSVSLPRSRRSAAATGAAHRVEGPISVVELGERLEWLRKRLLDLESQKLTFLRAVSHELKTPLASIRAGAQLLIARDDDPRERREVLGIIGDASRQLQKLVEDLLQNAALRPLPLGSARALRLDRAAGGGDRGAAPAHAGARAGTASRPAQGLGLGPRGSAAHPVRKPAGQRREVHAGGRPALGRGRTRRRARGRRRAGQRTRGGGAGARARVRAVSTRLRARHRARAAGSDSPSPAISRTCTTARSNSWM